jgi:hypothetical protein
MQASHALDNLFILICAGVNLRIGFVMLCLSLFLEGPVTYCRRRHFDTTP